MKITDVETVVVAWPPFEKAFWTSINPIGQVSELVVRVYTDDTIAGIGEAHGSGLSGAEAAVTEGLKPMLVGE